MKSKVCELLGIEYPILAFSHCRDVVAAVTKAGGFGVLGAVTFPDEELEVALDWIDSEVDGRPYGVDLLIPARYLGQDRATVPTDMADMIPAENKAFVQGIVDRFSLDDDEVSEAYRRRSSFSMEENINHIVEISFQHPIKLIASALGPPPPKLVSDAHDRGIVVAALAGKRQHAERHVAAGVDLIVAQGYEAAGHTGDIGAMVLIPEIVDAAAPVPVVAAGGIVSGRQMAAAMALGAQGVWCGSVWLTTEEAETMPALKQKMLAATSSDTVRSRSWTGKPARLLKTPWTDAWESPDAPEPLPFPLQSMLVGEVNSRINDGQHRQGSGAQQLVTGAVGQGVGQLNAIKPTRQVVLEMVEDFVDTVQRMSGLFDDE